MAKAAKKAPAKKVAIKKVSSKKAPAKKAASKKQVSKKLAVKKAPAKKVTAKKAPVKKAPVKKAVAKKAPAKKVTAKKAPVKKAVVKPSTQKKPVAKTSAVKKTSSPAKGVTKPAAPVTATRKAIQKPMNKPSSTPAPKPRAKTPYKPAKLPADYKPSTKEEYMNPLQLEYFRQKLLSWRDELIHESRETLDHLNQENWHQADIADRASLETEAGVELRTRNRYLKLISKIDAAIRRVETGEYGYCEETGEPIGLKRLEARPVATLSIEAQERHEKMEKQFTDED